jgi:hypothetical protein
MTTEGDEVKTAGLLITNQTLRHANILHPEKVLVDESGSSGFVVSQVSKARPGAPALSTCQNWGTRDEARRSQVLSGYSVRDQRAEILDQGSGMREQRSWIDLGPEII